MSAKRGKLGVCTLPTENGISLGKVSYSQFYKLPLKFVIQSIIIVPTSTGDPEYYLCLCLFWLLLLLTPNCSNIGQKILYQRTFSCSFQVSCQIRLISQCYSFLVHCKSIPFPVMSFSLDVLVPQRNSSFVIYSGHSIKCIYLRHQAS